MKVRLWHKTYAIAAIPLVFGICFFLYLSVLLHETQEAAAQEARAREALEANERMVSAVIEVGTAVYSYSRTLDPQDLAAYEAARSRLISLRDDIRPVGARWGGELAKNWKQGESGIDGVLNLTDETVALMPKHRQPVVQLRLAAISLDMMASLNHVRSVWSNIRDLIAKEVVGHEKRLAGRTEMVRRLVVGGIMFFALISLATALVLRRSVVSRLRQLSAYAMSLLKRDSAMHLSPSADEIGDLAASFEAMAKQIIETTRRERAIIDHAADIICVLSADGSFVQVSPAAQPLWGYEPDELIGKQAIELLTECQRAMFISDFEQACAAEQAGAFEAQIISRQGASVATRFSTRWSAETEQLYCVAHDISEMVQREQELRDNEERMRVIAEKLPAALFLVDERFVVERVNANAEQLTGTTSDALVGMEFITLFREQERIVTKNGVVQTQLRFSDGTMRWVEVSLDRFDDHQRQRYLAIALDVNERVELKQFRDKLIAMIAHDIGAPLSSLQMIFKLLEMGKYGSVNDSGKSEARDAEEQTSRLIKLFKDFVAIEREQARQYNSAN